jgi:hypothetical protein
LGSSTYIQTEKRWEALVQMEKRNGKEYVHTLKREIWSTAYIRAEKRWEALRIHKLNKYQKMIKNMKLNILWFSNWQSLCLHTFADLLFPHPLLSFGLHLVTGL